jgi:hypothetical protein
MTPIPKLKTPTSLFTAKLEQYWYIALWPDGTWCDWEDRYSYIPFAGDDYTKERVLSWDGAYCPEKTERVPL